MKITINRIESSPFSVEDVVSLIHASFKERAEQGLLFGCYKISVEEYSSYARNAIILVASDEKSNYLLGTTAFTINQNGNDIYAYNEFTAVAPDVKAKGIGSSLLLKEFELAENEGCVYVISDTAIKAKSSIRFHKKNGFLPMYITNYNGNNFYSIVMRKNLKKQSNCSNSLSIQLKLFISFIKCYLYQKLTGELKWIGRILTNIKQKA